MRHILEILTRSDETFAVALVQEEKRIPNCRVEVVDLSAPNPNYEELLRRIFEADVVHVW